MEVAQHYSTMQWQQWITALISTAYVNDKRSLGVATDRVRFKRAGVTSFRACLRLRFP